MAGTEGDAVDRQALLYCERSVELFTDLLSQLPTRAFVHTVLEDKAVLVKAKLSRLHSHPSGANDPHCKDCHDQENARCDGKQVCCVTKVACRC